MQPALETAGPSLWLEHWTGLCRLRPILDGAIHLQSGLVEKSISTVNFQLNSSQGGDLESKGVPQTQVEADPLLLMPGETPMGLTHRPWQ